jgi:hypothetical protein
MSVQLYTVAVLTPGKAFLVVNAQAGNLARIQGLKSNARIEDIGTDIWNQELLPTRHRIFCHIRL